MGTAHRYMYLFMYLFCESGVQQRKRGRYSRRYSCAERVAAARPLTPSLL